MARPIGRGLVRMGSILKDVWRAYLPGNLHAFRANAKLLANRCA